MQVEWLYLWGILRIIPLLFPLKTQQEPTNLTRNGAKSTPGDFPSVSMELLRIFGSSWCFPSNSFFSCLNICQLFFAILNCYPRLDSIAASLFENNWLSWQKVSDDTIQISLLITERGVLSNLFHIFSDRLRSLQGRGWREGLQLLWHCKQ